MTKEKCELEAGLLPIQSENSSLKFQLIEAEKVRWGGVCLARERRWRSDALELS